jgi:hypothetical protein
MMDVAIYDLYIFCPRYRFWDFCSLDIFMRNQLHLFADASHACFSISAASRQHKCVYFMAMKGKYN